MNMEGNWNGAAGSNKYQYNGKEWNDDFGLGLNDYGARFYDPAIARWTAVDPLGEMRANVTPYQYVQNNPMSRIDPTGMLDESRGADGMTNSQWMNASNPNNYGGGLESNYRNQNRAEDIDKERKRDKLNKFVSDGLSDDGDNAISKDDDEQNTPSKIFILKNSPNIELNNQELRDAINLIDAGGVEPNKDGTRTIFVGIGFIAPYMLDRTTSYAEAYQMYEDAFSRARRLINSTGNTQLIAAFADYEQASRNSKNVYHLPLVYPQMALKALNRIKQDFNTKNINSNRKFKILFHFSPTMETKIIFRPAKV